MRRGICRLFWITGFAAVLSLGGLLRADEPAAGSLNLYFIDVLGGAATLIVTPEKESILIDSGWPGQDDRDPKRIAHVLKDVAGCDHLDHLVTTHWHIDHYGGVAGLAKQVEIKHFWDRGLPEDQDPRIDYPEGPKPDDQLGIAYRETSQGKRAALKPGDSLPLQGKLKSVVLAAGGRVIDPPAAGAQPNPVCESIEPDHEKDTSDNARSVTLRFRFGAFDFLDCGDLTWNIERALICPTNLVGKIDLYQVTHHGLDISNHPALLRTIEPTVAIMNNGPRKGGSAETVKRIKALSSIQAFYQLHKNQQTSADENTDPSLIANQDPAGGKFIHVSVAPDGSRYTVQIGADGATRTFESK